MTWCRAFSEGLAKGRRSSHSVTAFGRVSTGCCSTASVPGTLSVSMDSVEHARLVGVHQYAVVQVPFHRARQHHFFQIRAFLDQVVEGVAMRDARHVLFDDGAVVERFGDVMRSRADQLAPL